MTRPMMYQRANEDFEAYLLDARERLDTPSRNVAYTSTDGVFRAFRARLEIQQALDFANVLPAVLRAIFVQDWVPTPPQPWGGRKDWTREAKLLRQHHNLSPDTVVADVAWALRRHVDEATFEAVLARLPQEARAFWGTDPDSRT
jgi:uncharacterized protein (DUF2267 family)|tara:strand:+ start:470 stop:904 length:435 start_codon:yes stop_codon:yes gene_type:complete